MERNTIIAVVLSSVVLILSFTLQSYFMSRRTPQQDIPIQREAPVPVETERAAQTPSVPAQQEIAAPPPAITETQSVFIEEDSIVEERVTIDTEFFTAVLTSAGGDMVSFQWKDPRNQTAVNLILSGDEEARAFSLAFGDHNAAKITSNFHVNRIDEYSVEFYRDFSSPTPVYGTDGRFRLTKRYDFIPSEYMFRLTVILDGGFSVPGFNFDGNAYTISFGPQIGPPFERLDNIYDYRQYSIYTNGKRRDAKPNEIIDSRPSWAAISGKYFTFIARPLLAQYNLHFSDRAEPGIASASRLNIIRPSSNVSKIEDTFQFYLGPKTRESLVVYNNGRNEFNIRDANMTEIAATRGFMGIFSPLESLLKWLLLGIYRVVPNYGLAIILLTLLIKLLFFPLTKKGSEATQRMQALAPRIKEIQEKYKSNPQKLQVEMGNFYKQENYNPLSGCLPMLLQIPIFISMYSLFNNHFDLRGASFIPGWIPDLSIPEYIVQFEYFRVPILGWTALRALPFIYVASQLFYGKVTQMPGQQSNTQMKMMMYVMPIVFFFVLYNVPSGLLIYWIFSNLFTLVQQLIINKFVMAKRAAAQAAGQSTSQPDQNLKIAPGKKKKSKF